MATGTAGMTVLPPVKSVVVYKNGDPFYAGRRFVVNQRQVASMEAFLTEVTQSIGASLAIRTLYTPRQGHRVTELEDLQTGAQYVAAVNKNLHLLETIREDNQLIQRPNVSAKWRKFIHVPCILHVFRNGDLLCPPFRFIIPRSMRQDLNQILGLVTEKVSLRTGAVRRLCSLDGVPVSSAAELETGHCYVAVGTERFKKLSYVELLVSKAADRYFFIKSVNKVTCHEFQRDGRRVKSTGDEAAAPRSRRNGAEETSALFARPVMIRSDRRPPRPPLIQPSVFKRAARKRREEVRGAEEVHEDENTSTELPVDQRVAEIVEDEEKSSQDDAQSTTQTTRWFFADSRLNECLITLVVLKLWW
uniref:Doublecortin domain-containing protein n=1 Tax=Mola mola TaxID=94237 RepID=A0A3Q3WF63_MOLML